MTKLGISSIVAQVIINRGIDSLEDAKAYVNPEVIDLPSPLDEMNFLI